MKEAPGFHEGIWMILGLRHGAPSPRTGGPKGDMSPIQCAIASDLRS